MRSISKLIDGPTIAAEVRMERQTHKGSFLLVEGANDIKRFERVVAEGPCSFVNCFGKVNTQEAIGILYDDGFPGALGMIDADFDRILDRKLEHEGIVVSATHDFDLDAATTTILERYLNEVADSSKLVALGGARVLLTKLLESIKPLTAMRYANERHQLGYKLKSLRIEEFFDGEKIDVGAMIDVVSWGDFSSKERRSEFRRYIDRYASSNIDLAQATCGHDFCAALGIALRNLVGDRKTPQTWQSEIELHFRLAFDLGHFRETAVYGEMATWESENQPFQVLRKA